MRLGQWVTPSSRFLAGKDGTGMIPQQMLVQVGDKAETRFPKPLSLSAAWTPRLCWGGFG